jgi:hypothetical protein
MKKYIIYVGENNERKKMVLDALKAAGFQWPSPLEVEETKPWLFLNNHVNGRITHTSDWEYVAEKLGEGSHYPLNASWVIKNAHDLAGANPPEKTVTLSDGTEISESTIRGWAKRFGEGE